MFKFFNDYLTFSRRERSGVLLLLTLCLLSYLWPRFLIFLPAVPEPDFTAFEEEAAALMAARKIPSSPEVALFPFDPNDASIEELQALGIPRRTARTILKFREKGGRFYQKSDLRRIYNLDEEDYRRLEPYIRLPELRPSPPAVLVEKSAARLFEFDPRTVRAEELQEMGLSEKVALTFVRFREKGGKFEKPEDLLRVYGMTPEDVRRLTPYVRFPRTPSRTPADSLEEAFSAPETEPLRIDINRASASEWQQLYGIGPVLSARIVRFREKLGGFHAVEQIRETYGLPDSTFQKIKPFLEGSAILRPLAVNSLEWRALSDHPYLNRRQARAIVAYRRQHGPFSCTADLDKVLALPEEVRTKMKPYWNFD